MNEYTPELEDATRVFSQLMAAAKLQVVMDAKIPAPAAYDPKTRTLYIGTLIPAQQYLRHGLAIHEVGHRLYSNLEPLFDTEQQLELRERFFKVKRIFNIIDDGYQERCVVTHFPGTKKHLQAIFDTFIECEDDPKLNLVVRTLNTLNYNCKGRKYGRLREYDAKITGAVLMLLKRAEMWHDASVESRIKISEDVKQVLKDLVKEEKQQKKQQDDAELEKSEPVPGAVPGDEGAEDDDTTPEKTDPAVEQGNDTELDKQLRAEPNDAAPDSGAGNEDPKAAPEAEAEDAGQEDEESEAASSAASVDNPGDEEELDEQLEETLDDLLESNKDAFNDHHDKLKVDTVHDNVLHLLTYRDLKKVAHIVDILYTMKDDAGNVVASLKSQTFSNIGKIQRSYGEHLAKARVAANTIFSKFTSKVQARNYINTRYLKSGRLDIKRLPFYRLNEDIFQNVAIRPNHANHAFVVMLDWSSSMQNSVVQLTDRVLELAQFAKMADIELEVWLYTSEYVSGRTKNKYTAFSERNMYKNFITNAPRFIRVLNTREHRDMVLNSRLFALFTLASLNANGANLLRRHWNSTIGSNVNLHRLLNLFSMNTTTIQESIIFAQGRAQELKADNKTIFMLTDGADDVEFSCVIKGGAVTVRNKKLTRGFQIGDFTDLRFNGNRIELPEDGRRRRQHINEELVKHYSPTEMIGIGWNFDGAKHTFGADKTIIINTADTGSSMTDKLLGRALTAESVTKPKSREYVTINNKILDSIVTHLLGDNV